ncbi:MAG TPA: dihydrofolate reductase family protein [Gemmatimonadales bacterium]|nr:dihydrofolate reductase family protein [Gemmatimonadales bacterium]
MKTSAFVGTSLDGFIARPDGGLDFLHVEGAGGNGYEEFVATVDALIIGRKTYETVLGFDRWPYGTKPVFVLSSGPVASPPAGAVLERLSGTPEEVVTLLAARGFQHLYVDGGVTIQRFLRAGRIDRLIVTRVPVLIGAGIPLFGPLEADIPLRHLSTRPLAGGLVQSEYEVIRSGA